MADTLRKVRPGDPLTIPASTFNTFVDAANDFLGRRHDQYQGSRSAARHSGIVLVRNDSGSDAQRCAALGIDGPVFGPTDNADEFKSRLALKVVAPTSQHRGKFIILMEPLAANAIGLAWADGVAIAQASITDAKHLFVDLSTSGALASCTSGSAAILWKESATGSAVWCVLRLGVSPAGTAQSPLVLDGTGATADARTWSADSQPAGKDGVEYQPARLYWSGTVGEAIKLFVRTPRFDSAGRLIAVSAEVETSLGTGPC